MGRIDAVRKILDVVCRTTGMGFSAVARVTESHWVACAVHDEIAFGLQPGGELDIKTTICNEIRQSGKLVVIDDVGADPAFCNHDVPRRYGFRSYISVPIILPGGVFFGTLCAIDPNPARLNRPEVVGMFTLFAELIAQHLVCHDQVDSTAAALAAERDSGAVREQFIAVLGHDLRSPVAAIRAGAQAILREARPGRSADAAAMIVRSAERMGGLISNILDFARGRLGGGLTLALLDDAGLSAALGQVIDEAHHAAPARVIHREIDIDRAVRCDAMRLSQLLSNLLANAITHGDPESPTLVRAICRGEQFELSVTNRGGTIPPAVMEHLFKPFTRGSVRPGQEGLGLGLYIAAQIAKAHNGTLSVRSADEETCFTLVMPVGCVDARAEVDAQRV